MMRRMLGTLALLAATPAWAAAPATTHADSLAVSLQQIALMQQQLRLETQYNQSLLNVVLWALSFAALFLVSLTALVGLLTERRYKQDRIAQLAAMESEGRRLQSELELRLNELLELQRAAQETRNAETRKMLSTSLETKLAETVSPLAKSIRELEEATTLLEIKNYEREAAEWTQRGSHSNAFRDHFERALLARELGHEYTWIVSNALEMMRDALVAGATPDAEEVREVTKFLATLPAEYAKLRAAIEAAL